MKTSELSKYFSKIGKRGGKARLTKMTKEERTAIAKRAGEASAKAKAKKGGK